MYQREPCVQSPQRGGVSWAELGHTSTAASPGSEADMISSGIMGNIISRGHELCEQGPCTLIIVSFSDKHGAWLRVSQTCVRTADLRWSSCTLQTPEEPQITSGIPEKTEGQIFHGIGATPRQLTWYQYELNKMSWRASSGKQQSQSFLAQRPCHQTWEQANIIREASNIRIKWQAAAGAEPTLRLARRFWRDEPPDSSTILKEQDEAFPCFIPH